MLPDFLCIGAQRSGTTWLDSHLRRHPEIWLSPLKEIRYFGCPREPYILKVFANDPRVRGSARRRWRDAIAAIRASDSVTMSWAVRFCFLPRNDHWYASLFRPSKDQVAGDITPGYSTLSQGEVCRIHGLLPDARIIYLLRNPIERIWSQASQYFGRYVSPNLREVGFQHISRFLDSPNPHRHTDYLGTLQKWESCYPGDQLHIGFLEEITRAPVRFLRETLAFLGVDSNRDYLPDRLEHKVNKGSYPSMPEHLSHRLALRYYGPIIELHDRFDNEYTAKWVSFARRYLS